MKLALLILIVVLANDVSWSQRVENIPKSVVNIEVDTQNYCNHLYSVGEQLWGSIHPADKRKSYDTLKAMIESCAPLKDVPCCGPPRFAFGEIGSDVADMDTINSRWLELRNWGMKVLYLSQDSLYYCSDVDLIGGTLNFYLAIGGEKGRGIDVKGIIAIIDYLLKENRCPFETQTLIDNRVYLRNNQVTYWRDSVTDSLKTPLDTSAISIDSIGFSILRGPQFGAVRPSGIRNGFGLSELKANRNPFKDETTLQTHIEDATVLKLEIIDLLGKSLYSEDKFFVRGDIHWVVNGKSLPEGSFYARLSTHEGDVRTIKLIKE